MEFKDKLKKLRKERGLSQQALADAIFVSRSAIAKWENGLGFPSQESLAGLQEFFRVSAEELSTQEPEKVIAGKNRRIRALHLRLLALLLAGLLIFGWIFPHTDSGMKLTVLLFRPMLEECIRSESDETFWGYRVRHFPESGAVFFEDSGWGYRGFFYSADGAPVGYQGTDMVFYRCGKDQWYWGEENGDNWMHAVRIIGNWFWYEMHF